MAGSKDRHARAPPPPPPPPPPPWGGGGGLLDVGLWLCGWWCVCLYVCVDLSDELGIGRERERLNFKYGLVSSDVLLL